MADIHIQRLRSAMEKLFQSEIDMSDSAGRPEHDRKMTFLSRAVAAYAIHVLTRCSPDDAGKSVTDGFDDGGIDAIYFDRENLRLAVCQSKWVANGNGAPSQADTLKFIAGVKDLVNLRLAKLNEKIRAKSQTIREAILNADVQIVLVLAYTGTEGLAEHAQRELTLFLDENNNPSPTCVLEVFPQQRLYSILTGGRPGESIELEIALSNWGCLLEPYAGYYGTVFAKDVAEWWHEHGSGLLAKNIRNFKGRTDVNAGLEQTLQREPQNFWYYNNGITLLCDKIKKKPLGGSLREHGIFECFGVSVVNGAQTVGLIGSTFEESACVPDTARVHVRMISLENCPDGFDKVVTRATNTQNRIEGRDFAAMDSNQRRLASEFALDNRQYAFKSGDQDPRAESGCSIVDATIALACSQSEPSLAVQVKNQIGRIWDNLDSPPYTTLFNEQTTSTEIWRKVLVMRAVDARLGLLGLDSSPRAELVATHGNRFILHRVFQDPTVKALTNGLTEDDAIAEKAAVACDKAFYQLASYLENNEKNSYLVSCPISPRNN